jgi:hypothetical protein
MELEEYPVVKKGKKKGSVSHHCMTSAFLPGPKKGSGV